MIKFRKIVTYQIERYPESCKQCPAYSEHPYSCHNERGWEAACELGYMKGLDMRDCNSNRLFCGCRMQKDNRVTLMKPKEEENNGKIRNAECETTRQH